MVHRRPLSAPPRPPGPERAPTDSAGMEVLSEEDCWALLAGSRLGRVGIVRQGVPEILPISYRLVEGEIVFRTGLGSRLSAALLRSSVAFEVDRVDEDAGEAWSVQVLAAAHVREIDAAADAALLAGIQCWTPQPGRYLVRLVPRRVTGRRVRPAALDSR